MGMLGEKYFKNIQQSDKKKNTADVLIIANSPMMSDEYVHYNLSMMGQGYKSVRVGTHRQHENRCGFL
jgi:hypothetical protein